jgi:hypothetical protein
MPRDFACNQGNWLDTVIVDRFVNGGICHALSMDWAVDQVQGNVFQLSSARYRAVSGQRAYKMAFEHRLQGLWAMGQYVAWLAQARPPTQNFARSCLRGQQVNMVVAQGLTLLQVENAVRTLPANQALVIIMWGADPAQPADSQNWGHTVAFARLGAGYRFFDANQGQFSWPPMSPPIFVAEQVTENIHNQYHGWQYREFDTYTLS